MWKTSLRIYSFRRRIRRISRKQRSLMAPRRAHCRRAIYPQRARVDRLGAQVRYRPHDGTDVRSVGARKRRGGAHGRASRRRKVALDRATKVRQGDSLFLRYVYHIPRV